MTDTSSFTQRREALDILHRLLDQGSWLSPDFEDAMATLEAQRAFSLRQLLSSIRETCGIDDLLALDLLARLVHVDDAELLAEVANDPTSTKTARIACTLILLGQDQAGLIRDQRLSSMVLQWQAQYLAEEPSLRFRLQRLYRDGPLSQRSSWVRLQDASLEQPDGRAAVFEMLLEVEIDPELRLFIIEALAKVAHPSTVAALARVEASDEGERHLIDTRSRQLQATMPATDHSGWNASVGFCDAGGCFPLRFERRGVGRGRRITFVLDVQRGIREALTLTGHEMAQLQDVDISEQNSNGIGGTTFSIPLGEAMSLLNAADSRTGLAAGKRTPDLELAWRLLDPLADIQPTAAGSRANEHTRAARESSSLLEHPGYSGWCYDAGNHLLDEFRLEALAHGSPKSGPTPEIIDQATQRLAQADAPRRLRAMLQHNSIVHHAAGELEERDLADSAARIIAHGGYDELTLVRDMVRKSLHPALYFLSPSPALPNRSDIVQLVVGSRRPLKSRVFAVDLGLMFSRAIDVWLSRIPSHERPDAGSTHHAMVELARAGSRLIPVYRDLDGGSDTRLVDELAGAFHETLQRCDFPSTQSDPDFSELIRQLIDSSIFLVRSICRDCPVRCIDDPNADGLSAIQSQAFPAGVRAESQIRGWPGRFLHEPSPEMSVRLESFIRPSSQRRTPDDTFSCPACCSDRPLTARSKTMFQASGVETPASICRRCQRAYRTDDERRAEIEARGTIIEP